jgi:hypothetical protein
MEIAQPQGVLGFEVLDSSEQTKKAMIFPELRMLVRKLIDIQETRLMEDLNTKKPGPNAAFSIKGSYHI